MAGDGELKRWINLEKVALLVLEQSVHGQKIITEMVRGFGVRNITACLSVEEAKSRVRNGSFDLIIADPGVDHGKGLDFLRWLRRAERNPNRFVPIILASGHSTTSAVNLSRDSGANYFVAKPFTAKTLLDRILFVSRDKRSYIEVDDYLGPDRRVRDEGPPASGGRRASDFELEDARETVHLDEHPPKRASR